MNFEKESLNSVLSFDAKDGSRADFFAMKKPNAVNPPVYFTSVRRRDFTPDPNCEFTPEEKEIIHKGDVWNVVYFYETDSLLGYYGYVDIVFGFEEVVNLMSKVSKCELVPLGPHDNFQEALYYYESMKLYGMAENAVEFSRDASNNTFSEKEPFETDIER